MKLIFMLVAAVILASCDTWYNPKSCDNRDCEQGATSGSINQSPGQ